MLPVIWDRRTRTILVVSQWVALALGIFASTANLGPTPVALGLPVLPGSTYSARHRLRSSGSGGPWFWMDRWWSG